MICITKNRPKIVGSRGLVTPESGTDLFLLASLSEGKIKTDLKDCARWKQFSILSDWQSGPSFVQVHITQGETRLASPVSMLTSSTLVAQEGKDSVRLENLCGNRQMLGCVSPLPERTRLGAAFTQRFTTFYLIFMNEFG